jgi:hypothetical protein
VARAMLKFAAIRVRRQPCVENLVQEPRNCPSAWPGAARSGFIPGARTRFHTRCCPTCFSHIWRLAAFGMASFQFGSQIRDDTAFIRIEIDKEPALFLVGLILRKRARAVGSHRPRAIRP